MIQDVKNEQFVDKWGGIPLTDLKNRTLDKFVFTEDLEKLKKLKQPIVECIGIDSGFLVLKTESVIFKVCPQIFHVCKKPFFFVGEKIKTINSKGNIEYGTIKDMFLRVKNNEYMYMIEVNGKIKSRRYNELELEKIDD